MKADVRTQETIANNTMEHPRWTVVQQSNWR